MSTQDLVSSEVISRVFQSYFLMEISITQCALIFGLAPILLYHLSSQNESPFEIHVCHNQLKIFDQFSRYQQKLPLYLQCRSLHGYPLIVYPESTLFSAKFLKLHPGGRVFKYWLRCLGTWLVFIVFSTCSFRFLLSISIVSSFPN